MKVAATNSLITILARSAEPEDDQMTVIRLEIVSSDHGTERLGHRRLADADHPPASATDQMHVLVVGARVVGRRSIGEMRVPDHTELVQKLQSPVHGGQVDRVRDLGIDLLGCRVPEALDRGKDGRALWGEAVARGAELSGERGFVTACGLLNLRTWGFVTAFGLLNLRGVGHRYCRTSWAWMCGCNSLPSAAMS